MKHINITLDEATYEVINAISERRGKYKLSPVIREILATGLKVYQEVKPDGSGNTEPSQGSGELPVNLDSQENQRLNP